jgi:histidine triad (HIT) family protein
MASLFTKIIAGEVPCHKIYEDDRYLSFLDIRPLKTRPRLSDPQKRSELHFQR